MSDPVSPLSATTRSPSPASVVAEVDAFWYSETGDPDASLRRWFKSGADLDDAVRRKFSSALADVESKSVATLVKEGWLATPESYACLIVMLDQLSRHVYRNSGAEAYKNDAKARNVFHLGMIRHFDALDPFRKLFSLMPLQHSEHPCDHALCIELVDGELNRKEAPRLWKSVRAHALGHQYVIARFGRFPKRLPLRERTPEEREYTNDTPGTPY